MVRADARENRARILAAAREAFAEDDDTSMNQIAQRAGVGPGTLYRNYPSREALILDIYRDEVAKLIGAVPELLAAEPPLEALRRWTTELVIGMRTKHALGAALSPDAHKSISEQTYDPVIGAIAQLLDAGKADGSIREDAEPGDFLQFTGALWRAAPDRTQPMLALILDGLDARRSR
ncbi:TetR/AcrR family transcriptional regulator [Paractinoplanes brasiliensis]|uniref:TetR family transcriptional regulator n=1 Tax=Paractinoplanes brasiliensis TaxID=52695 RepID=A0A4R6JWU2_9ACTN|nr:TetR/AcrR family transcriptional regulator [Actinoplanes brasiliensis]TDO41250.1 TetR family transcriptional regulator [Actinoplanes brasiliensis]GID27467.1 TetR family transcriptional regulator [Actinoplanes brasiliensis]